MSRGAARGSARSTSVLALLCTLAVLTYLDRVCISVAGPRMQDALGIGPSAWGWVTGVFALSYGAFEIPSGALGDRFGPRKVLARIVLWWSAFTALTGAVSNYPFLLITRFCFGMGEAGAYPNASAAIARWFPASGRARAWGMVFMSSQIGGAIAPWLVTPIQMRYGWHASFFLFGAIGIVWTVFWLRMFRDNPDGQPPAAPAHVVPWRSFLRSANLGAIMAMTFCYVYTLYFFQSWLHTYLVRGRGYAEGDLFLSALPYLIGACANALGGVASDAMVRKLGLVWGRRALGISGLGCAGLFTLATLVTPAKLPALIFLALVYGGITFAQPTVWAVCLDVGGRHGGAVSGFMNTAGQAGAFVSSIMFGYLVERFGSYNAPLVPMAVLLFASSALWLKIDAAREITASGRISSNNSAYA